nr:hypothetical protein [Actinomadura hibisca]
MDAELVRYCGIVTGWAPWTICWSLWTASPLTACPTSAATASNNVVVKIVRMCAHLFPHACTWHS